MVLMTASVLPLVDPSNRNKATRCKSSSALAACWGKNDFSLPREADSSLIYLEDLVAGARNQ